VRRWRTPTPTASSTGASIPATCSSTRTTTSTSPTSASRRCAGASFLLGAPTYAAPETLGGGEATVAADVYALGVLAFELLEGERPPPDESLPLPATPVGEVLARATCTDPDERYESVSDLLLTTCARPSPGGGVADRPSPLPATRTAGSKAFQETDARDFHGREALVAELVAGARRTGGW
jgi:hypothetical protein